jgi:hypothetical protein
MKNILIIAGIVLSLMGGNALAQAEKYVVVPIQFDFLSQQDQYRANTLLRYLFKEKGYTAFFDTEELPEDLFEDRCKAIYANATKVKGFLITKIQIDLKDCRGNTIAMSEIGDSKEKEYKKAYHNAIRAAFNSIDFERVLWASYQSESEEALSAKIVPAELIEEVNDPEVTAEAVVSTSPSKETSSKEIIDNGLPTLFAQPLKEGEYQLVNMEPRVVMVIEKTEVWSIYKVKGEAESILFKQGDVWVYAKTVDGKTTETSYNVKF